MCRVGDIIVIKEYASHGVRLGRHSFVVINDQGGEICGMDYDLVCNVMSSFHSPEHRQKKLKFNGNLEYAASEEDVRGGHGKAGFIKADQFYYFKESEIDYYVIGTISPELYRRLIELIKSLDDIEEITENL